MTQSRGFKDKNLELRKLMRQTKVFEKDIKETFVHSSGPGGQNVNKVATCVVLVHIPTAIRVKCQEARTQLANRHHARRILVEKIEHRRRAEELKEQRKIAQARHKTKKLTRAHKEDILKAKHMNAEKKATRRTLHENELNKVLD